MTSLVKDENNRKVAQVCVGVDELRKEQSTKLLFCRAELNKATIDDKPDDYLRT